MQAVIHRVPDQGTTALLQVAGKPLIERQIAWLSAQSFDPVIVEIAEDMSEVADFLARNYTLGIDVILVDTDRAIGPRALARKAGIADGMDLVALPADLIGDGDLRLLDDVSNAFGVVGFFDPPKVLSRFRGGTVRVVRAPLHRRRPAVVRGPGFGLRVRDEDEAHELSLVVDRGLLPARNRRHAFPIEPLSRIQSSGFYAKKTKRAAVGDDDE
jgi:hypothetical protein